MMPSWRKPLGMILILLIILLWAIIVMQFSELIGRLPVLVQAPIYIVAGLVWIIPLRPLLLWMETGRWR
jgi:hypothetical protein